MILWTDSGLFDTMTGFQYLIREYPDRTAIVVVIGNDVCITELKAYKGHNAEIKAESYLKMLYDALQQEDLKTAEKARKALKILATSEKKQAREGV